MGTVMLAIAVGNDVKTGVCTSIAMRTGFAGELGIRCARGMRVGKVKRLFPYPFRTVLGLCN